ncbi:unnamed protein product [Prunus brigantina]
MSDSLVRVSRRAEWGAHRPMPGARRCLGTPRRRVLPTTIASTASPRAYQQPGLWPPPQSASVNAPSRSADRLVTNLPPDWGCIPKQPDSPTAPRGATGSGHNGALTLSGATFQWTWARSAAEDASPDYHSDAMGARFSSWAIPGSLAVTRGILPSRSPAIFSSPRCATTAHDGQPRFRNHRLSWRASPRTWHLCQPRGEAHGRPSSAPPQSRRSRWGGNDV